MILIWMTVSEIKYIDDSMRNLSSKIKNAFEDARVPERSQFLRE